MDEHVLLKYDGPALDEHRMDVRDLAPALMGLADAMQVAGKLLEPSAQVRLDIKASKEGSFEIDMLLDVVQNAGLFLAGGTATMWANGITIADAIKRAIMGAMVIAARVATHGGKPIEAGQTGDGSRVRITYPDGTSFEADNMDWAVFQNGKAMTGLEKVTEPLREGAIETLALSAGSDVAVVKVAERDGFSARHREEVLSDSTSRMVLELVDVKFRAASWRVSDGDATYSVDIDDTAFLAAVESGDIRFGNGDSLLAEVRVIQRRVNVNLRTERSIVKVHDVIQSAHRAIGGSSEHSSET